VRALFEIMKRDPSVTLLCFTLGFFKALVYLVFRLVAKEKLVSVLSMLNCLPSREIDEHWDVVKIFVIVSLN